MKASEPARDAVLIVRDGYPSYDQWRAAIAAAKKAGRDVITVDGEGTVKIEP